MASPAWSFSLLSPHFFYDLIRFARKGRNALVRIGYLLAILGGMALSVNIGLGSGWSQNQRSAEIERFVAVIFFVQNLAVLFLAPIYLGSAIVEERERRTLEMLYTTHLRDYEIILGKLLSRMVHLGVLILGGLPIIGLLQIMGGVDTPVIVANFVNTLLLLLAVSCYSIFISCVLNSVMIAVLVIYGSLVLFVMCSSPMMAVGGSAFFILPQMGNSTDPYQTMWSALLVQGTAYVFIGTLFLVLAIFNLRRPESVKVLQDEGVHAMPHAALTLDIRMRRLPPIGEKPLVWKECYVGGFWKDFTAADHQALIWGIGLPLLIPFVLLLFVVAMGEVGQTERIAKPLAMALATPVAIVTLLVLAFRATMSIAQERQQQTLDQLLTIPMERGEILRHKWLGIVRRTHILWGIFFSILFVACLFGGMGPVRLVGMLGSGLLQLFFYLKLGLFLSVHSKTVLQANLRMGTFLILLTFGTLLAMARWGVEFIQILFPWMVFLFPSAEGMRMTHFPIEIFFTICLVHGLGGALLWIWTTRTFNGEMPSE